MTPGPDPTPLSLEALVAALVAAGAAVIEVKDELTALDAAAGDGDLGATMARGFNAVITELEEADVDDGEAVLDLLGTVLMSKAPSTMGTLLGAGLSGAAPALAGKRRLLAEDVATVLEEVDRNIRDLGQAEPGQRTVVDATAPAAEAARAALSDGATAVAPVLAAARDAAVAGAEATATMSPAQGRARWTGDRARGVVDGGARMYAVWLSGLHEGLSDRD